ncbi:hypothetical protein [Mesorhizobium sp. 1M-11]|uniref:hypothetical protein n=1 Tax=Mesorhizobium sp. 1M-11 TaxID=1529006 RepID=UPI0006C74136|nr:hypothetical protein [Mesorhizobium sp. 1M-11]
MSARLAAGVFAVSLGFCTPAPAQDDVTRLTSEAPFQDIVGALEDAIVNRGYVVDYRGFIGEMLQRTAGDVGAQKALYRHAEFFQFCSAVVSRRAMEANVGNIAYCPYVLFAYETESEPGKVIVGFRRLPAGEGRDEVNTLLEEIAGEAAGEK